MDRDVVVVGSLNVDLVLTVARHPLPGETLMGGGGTSTPGGKGANQACAAALLGARTAMVGAVGDDANAPLALALLEGAGVDLGAVETVPGPTGLAAVTLSEAGENTIVVVPGANDACGPELVTRHADLLTDARVVVLQGEVPLPAVDTAARIAHEAGVRVLLNAAPAAAFARESLTVADPLVVNEHEASLVLAALTGDAVPPSPTSPEAAVALARALRAQGVPSVVVTLGAQGAVGVEPAGDVEPADAGSDGCVDGGDAQDRTWHVPAESVTAVDTTGAGDAFVGAVAAALAAGGDLHTAAARATRVAARSVQRLGAQASYPRLEDLA